MKFFYVGDFYKDWSTEWLIADQLLKAGHTVVKFQEDNYNPTTIMVDFRRAIKQDNQPPEVVLFTKFQVRGASFKHNPQVLESLLKSIKSTFGTPLVCWQFDLLRREFSEERYRWASAIAPICDLFLSTDAGLDIPNNTLLRQGCPGPSRECDVGRGQDLYEYSCEVAHVGGVYGWRRDWAANLQQHFNFRVFDKVRGDKLFDVCKSAKIVIGPPYPAFPGYWSNRLYAMTGYGACLACPEVSGMAEEGWIPDVHYCKLPEHLDEQIPVLHKLLLDEERRRAISEAGQRFTFANHTFKHRVANLLERTKALCPVSSLSAAESDPSPMQ